MHERMAIPNRLGAAVAGLIMAIFVSAPALAAGCSLRVIADLPVTMEGDRLSVPAKVNGKNTRFWLDSGAYFSMMPLIKAKELGLPLEPSRFGAAIMGVGGMSTVQVTHIKSFVIVDQNIPDLAFLVGGSDVGGGLIGSDILGLADTEFDLADGSVKMTESRGCEHTAMTYWNPGKPFFTVPLLDAQTGNHVFNLPVTVNGKRLDAQFDTGAETSVISRSAALRIGIDLSGTGIGHDVGGVGGHLVKGWVVPIAKVTIGDEQILNTHIEVVDDGYSSGHGFFDMLLGADYIMAHHIYVARRPRLIFLTYSGGPAFRTSLDNVPKGSAKESSNRSSALSAPSADSQMAEVVMNGSGTPKTAGAFARRGAARLTAQNTGGALADFNEAIRQSPGTADYYADRARVYRQMGEAVAARADLDKALALDGTNGEVLRLRAEQRFAAKDRDGALADAEAATRVTPPASLENAGLANLFVQLHQPARAIPMYNAVIDAHHDDSAYENLLNARCWARALANVDLDNALADCNRAIKGDARADWFDSRGLVYFRKASYAAAIRDYDAALKISPREAWSLYMRGQARIALGQIDAGKADQASARTIRPDISDEVAAYGIGMASAKIP